MNRKLLIFLLTICLFFVPFFWLKQGYVNYGGDGGRLYLFDPLSVLKNSLFAVRDYSVYVYANIPYTLFIYLISKITANTIAVEYGLQLSLGFLGIYLVVKELLSQTIEKIHTSLITLVSITSGFVYISFVTKTGWSSAFVTQNQVFLNPLVFYLLLKYCTTRKNMYMFLTLVITFIFSSNFGFTSIPQIISFFPLCIIFLLIYLKFIIKANIPFRGLIVSLITFIGIHAFHLLPVIRVLFARNTYINDRVFGSSSIQNDGVSYFLANHTSLGKMSVELFHGSIVVPLIAVSGFLFKKTRLLGLVGVFFLFTLYLATANITHIGVKIYEFLFHIPGFLMFRSFDEKWYFVFSFFYALLFGISLYYLLEKRIFRLAIIFCAFIIGVSVLNHEDFYSGKDIYSTIHPSENISTVYIPDPDVFSAVSFIKGLPQDGKVLNAPLTYTYFQIAQGKTKGAYLGISMISSLSGRQDFPGLWSFENYRNSLLQALENQDLSKLMQIFSALNIRYIFYNSDPTMMHNLASFYDPSDTNSGSEIPKTIQTNAGYESLLAKMPVKKIFNKGFYSVYEIDSTYIQPLIYSEDIPNVSYTKKSSAEYTFSMNIENRTAPFLLIFSNKYDDGWELKIIDLPGNAIIEHKIVNNYSNGWIIDPKKLNSREAIHGKISLVYQTYFYTGAVISICTLFIVLLVFILRMKKK